MSRIDDVINVAGHRLSTGAMEEVLAAHPDVAECAVIGVADELKGEVPRRASSCSRPGSTAADAEHRRASWSTACASRSARSPAFKTATVVKRAAQDPLRQDPARHHEEHRRRPGVQGPGHDRRSGDPGRDHGAALKAAGYAKGNA